MQIEKVKISQVKNNPNNPRVIKNDDFRKLVKSIKEAPWMLQLRSIIVNDDNIVLGGNQRLRACKEAGLKEVYIIKASSLSEEQQREFIVKDNLSSGEWDWDALANEFEIEDLENWGLDLPVDLAVQELEAEEDDYEMPNEIKTDIVLGDLIEIGEHRLLCGDSTDSDQVAKLMNGEKADMVFTDPPYNALKSWNKKVGKSETKLDPKNWFKNDDMEWDEFNQFLLDAFKNFNSHSIYVCCDYRIFDIVKKNIELCDYIMKHCIVWKKNMWGLGKRYRFQHEFIVYATQQNDSPFFGNNSQSDVWEVDVDRKTEHNTPKPIALPSIAIKNSSKVNNIILDVFGGSGSTMCAAHQIKRKCYMMELSPNYCQLIIDRMLKLDSALEVKINGKPYKNTNNV